MKRRAVGLFCLFALILAFPTPAAAYLDPMTGSILWQVVIGGLLAGAMWLRIYWRKIRALFSKKPPIDDSDRP